MLRNLKVASAEMKERHEHRRSTDHSRPSVSDLGSTTKSSQSSLAESTLSAVTTTGSTEQLQTPDTDAVSIQRTSTDASEKTEDAPTVQRTTTDDSAQTEKANSVHRPSTDIASDTSGPTSPASPSSLDGRSPRSMSLAQGHHRHLFPSHSRSRSRSSSRQPKEDCPGEVAGQWTVESAIGAGKGISRIARVGMKAPLDFTMGIAQGFHNAPKLYGDDTVREQQKITGFQSGLKAAGRELTYGFFDGITGLATQPIRGAEKEGPAGFVKGFAKGIGGLILVSNLPSIARNEADHPRNLARVYGESQATLSKAFMPSFRNCLDHLYRTISSLLGPLKDMRNGKLRHQNNVPASLLFGRVVRWSYSSMDEVMERTEPKHLKKDCPRKSCRTASHIQRVCLGMSARDWLKKGSGGRKNSSIAKRVKRSLLRGSANFVHFITTMTSSMFSLSPVCINITRKNTISRPPFKGR